MKPNVRVHKTMVVDFSPTIDSIGSIVYTRKNDITSAVEGTLTSIPHREGIRVNSGTILVKMENVQLSINHEQAKSAYEGAKASTFLAEQQYNDYTTQLESRFLSISKLSVDIDQKKKLLTYMKEDLNDVRKIYSVGGVSKEQLKSAELALSNAECDLQKLIIDKDMLVIGFRDADILEAGFAIPEDPNDKKKLLITLNSRLKQAEVRLARSQEHTAKTQLDSAEALLNELTIRSPAEGIVGAVYKELGERVEAGEKIMTIFDSKEAWCVFTVNERESVRLSRNMDCELFIESIGAINVPAKIDVISPTVDPQSGNITVKALLSKELKGSKPGMLARITVSTAAPSKRMFIPRTCLVERVKDSGVVISVRNNRVFKRNVTLGIDHEDRVEVIKGLQSGESLVIEPTPLLKEGDEVSINENS